MKHESQSRVLLVSFSIIFLCSLFVSGAVSFLRPIQAEQSAPQNSRHILRVAGLIKDSSEVNNETDINKYFKYVEIRSLDLTTGYLLSPVEESKQRNQESSEANAIIKLDKVDDLAKLQEIPKLIPVYLIHSTVSKAKIVLPISGKGMWSMIRGYIALERDLNTIADVYFYEQNETPGIGERIQELDWLKLWQGKKLYDASGALVFDINGNASSENRNADSNSQVDGITGATRTVEGIADLIHFWFGQKGYQPFLNKRKEASGD